MQEAIVGVWTLQAFYLENVATGERSEPFGPAPRGVMMFHRDGRMAALLTPADRSAPVTEADQAAAFQKLIACSGPYRLEPPDRFVISVDVAWFEPWIGTEQVRTYKLDGDRLDIVSAPFRMPQEGAADATVIGILAWERESSWATGSSGGANPT